MTEAASRIIFWMCEYSEATNGWNEDFVASLSQTERVEGVEAPPIRQQGVFLSQTQFPKLYLSA